MGQYKWKINPHTGRLGRVLNSEELEFPENLVDLNDIEFDSGTPIDGQVLTYDEISGKWKAEDASGGGGTSGARVRAYYKTFMGQSIPSDESMQKVLFDVEQWDINDEFTNSEFTAKEAGYYLVIGEIRYFDTSGADYTVSIGVYKNNNCTKSKNIRSCGDTIFPCIEITDTVYCEVGDIIDIRATQTSGSNQYIVGIDSSVATNIIINKL